MAVWSLPDLITRPSHVPQGISNPLAPVPPRRQFFSVMKLTIPLLVILLLTAVTAWFFTARSSQLQAVSPTHTASAPVLSATLGESKASPPTNSSLDHTSSIPHVATTSVAASITPSNPARSGPVEYDKLSAPSTSSPATLLPEAPQPDASATASYIAGAAEVEYEIPAGMRAPAVLLPEDRPRTPPIQRFLDDVRREFDATIAAADDPAAVWEEARQHADNRYRLLFGDNAYNQKTMQDAIDALRSKGAVPAAASPPSLPTP